MRIQLTLDTVMQKSGIVTNAYPSRFFHRFFDMLGLRGLPELACTDGRDDHQIDVSVRHSVTYAVRDTYPECVPFRAYGADATFIYHSPNNCIGHITVTPIGRNTYEFDLVFIGGTAIPGHPAYRGEHKLNAYA